MLGITGLFAPIVTPFTDDANAVSEIRLARLVKHLVGHGVEGFVCGSETGEFVTISAAERKEVLEILIREARGMPILVHCTRIGTAQSLDLCQHAARHGAKAAIVMPPYFGVYTDEEIGQHLRRILQHAGLPVIVVDPKHLVRAGTRDRLHDLPGLYYAESPENSMRTRFAVDPVGIGSDEFVCGEAVISPLIQIDPIAAKDPAADMRQLARAIGTYGRPRAAKAALNARDVEVGPPRSPVLPLGHKETQEFVASIQTD